MEPHHVPAVSALPYSLSVATSSSTDATSLETYNDRDDKKLIELNIFPFLKVSWRIPTQLEVKVALNTLHRFLSYNSRYAQIVTLYNMITPVIMEDTVTSLLCDKKVWKAVQGNEGVMRLRKHFHSVTYSMMIKMPPSESGTSTADSIEKPGWASRIIKWTLENCIAIFSTVTGLAENLASLMNGDSNKKKNASIDGALEADDIVKFSWTISLFTSMIVIATRAFRAVFDSTDWRKNALGIMI